MTRQGCYGSSVTRSGPARGAQRPPLFHILSFEGPDAYARAGGLASRINGLTEALAEFGFDTHLWFVGDPILPGDEAKGASPVRFCRERIQYGREFVWRS